MNRFVIIAALMALSSAASCSCRRANSADVDDAKQWQLCATALEAAGKTDEANSVRSYLTARQNVGGVDAPEMAVNAGNRRGAALKVLASVEPLPAACARLVKK